MAEESKFYGKPISYWIELDRKARELNVENLIDEIAELRAKVSFYESRIEEMNMIKNRKKI